MNKSHQRDFSCQDATAVIEMKPDFMKGEMVRPMCHLYPTNSGQARLLSMSGWFLLVKAFWKEGNPITVGSSALFAILEDIYSLSASLEI